MMVTFQPIKLEFNHGDEDAVLVLRSGQLVAVAARLGGHHEEVSGEWFIEAVFTKASAITGRRYKTLEDISTLIETE